jgi:hypothetical protein
VLVLCLHVAVVVVVAAAVTKVVVVVEWCVCARASAYACDFRTSKILMFVIYYIYLDANGPHLIRG